MTIPATRPAFSDPATQPVLPFLGLPERLLVTGRHSGGELAVLESSAPHGHACPWHRHRFAAETFVVLDGELLLDVDGQRHLAGPGHVAVLPRDLPHGFVVVSDHARWLTLHTPAGFDDFVRAVSDATHADGPPDRAVLTAVAAEYGIDILGPGIALPTPSTHDPKRP